MERYIIYCDRETLEKQVAKPNKNYQIRDSEDVKAELQEDFGFSEVFEEPFCLAESSSLNCDDCNEMVTDIERSGFRRGTANSISESLLKTFGDQTEFLRQHLTYQGLREGQEYLDSLYRGEESDLAPETSEQNNGLIFRLGHYAQTVEELVDSMLLFKRFAQLGGRFRERAYETAQAVLGTYAVCLDGNKLMGNETFKQQIAHDIVNDTTLWDLYLHAEQPPRVAGSQNGTPS
ncbi:MAG: hypothetical protein ABEK59_02330 [Halobacteria archaeon]